jgi:hypothetical protein
MGKYIFIGTLIRMTSLFVGYEELLPMLIYVIEIPQ